MSTNTENTIPNNVRPFSAPAKGEALRTPAKNIVATTPSRSRPSTATKKTAVTPVSSREAAILAKAQHTAEKQKKTSMLREKWANEKILRKEQNAKKREEEMKVRQSLSSMATKARQKNIRKSNKMKKEKQDYQRDLLKSSITENIAARRSVDQAEKIRRRQSIMVNREILTRAKKNQVHLLNKQKQEEDSLHVSRRIDFLSVRDSKLEEDEKRRKSMEAKNAYSRMQHELEKELEAVKKEQQSDMLAVRKDMYEDDNQAKAALKASRRQSLVGRLETWRTQRKVESKQQQAVREALQLDIIQKHEDWMDIQEAKKEYKDRARQSVLWRLDKWRETKDLEFEEAAQKQMAEDVSRDLFLQEYEDVMQYRQEQEDLRRQSLAYRLDHGAREKEWERGEQYVQQAEREHEIEVQAEDRADIANYKEQLKEDRRASLAFRLEKGAKDREFFAGQTALEREVAAEDYVIRAEDQRAVSSYKESQRKAERDEVARGIAESQRQKEKALQSHRKMLDIMHQDFESKARDWTDVNEYKAKQKARSRESICLRLDSWRQGRMAEERLHAREQREQEDDAAMRAEDFQAVQSARKKQDMEERARNITCFL